MEPAQEIYFVEQLVDVCGRLGHKHDHREPTMRVFQDVLSFERAKAHGEIVDGDRITFSSQVCDEDDADAEEQAKHITNKEARREKMRLALRGEEVEEEEVQGMFKPSSDDLNWVRDTWVPWVDSQSRKATAMAPNLHPLVVEAKEQKKPVPRHLRRQVARTASNYTYGLRLIAQMYQKSMEKKHGSGYRIQYRDFLDFGSPRHILLASPKKFLLDTWKEGSFFMKKQANAAHACLHKLVESECFDPGAIVKFPGGLTQQQAYIKHLKHLTYVETRAGVGGKLQQSIDIKQEYDRKLRETIWTENYGIGQKETMRADIKKFIQSEWMRSAEDLLMDQAHMVREGTATQLPLKEALMLTKAVTLRLLVLHGGRTEVINMTLREWLNRSQMTGLEHYTVIVERDWTKLTGLKGLVMPTLSLNQIDELLCAAYEVFRAFQWPNDKSNPDVGFFLNSKGTDYFVAGNGMEPSQLAPWTDVTLRADTPTSFRHAVSNFSLTTDEVTRLNLSFSNNHSLHTMNKFYIGLSDKAKAGVQALLKYRKEGINLNMNILTNSGRKLKVRGLGDVEARQAQSKLSAWYNAQLSLKGIIRKDAFYASCRDPTSWCNDESKYALVDLCAEEIKSGLRVGQVYLADLLLRGAKEKEGEPRVKGDEIDKAIISLIDSPRFKESPFSESLERLMINAARVRGVQLTDEELEDENKTSVQLDMTEKVCCRDWRKQLYRLTARGLSLNKSVVIAVALMEIWEATGTTTVYDFGSKLVNINVEKLMAEKRQLELAVIQADKKEVHEEDENHDATAVSPRTFVHAARRLDDNENAAAPFKRELKF